MTMITLSEEFGNQYDFVCETENRYFHSEIEGYYEVLDTFSELLNSNEEFTSIISEFVNCRHDYISSDREIVEFMFVFALKELIL